MKAVQLPLAGKSCSHLQRQEASSEVMEAMTKLQAAGSVPKWGKALDGTFTRRSVMIGELRQVGVKAPDQIAVPSVRNDFAFLVSVVAFSSVLAVGSSFLPGAQPVTLLEPAFRRTSTSGV